MLAFWALVALACMNDAVKQSSKPEEPHIEAGVLIGRDGVSFGPGAILQGTVGRVGLYGFAGTSSIGYSSTNGVRANLRDRTLGFGIQYRVARLGRHFSIGAFSEAAYYGSHIQASYFEPVHKLTEEYRASDRDPLVTVGPEIDYKITEGLRIAMRPGKDFGENFAAQTAGGFSIKVGVLIDTHDAGLHIARGFKKLVP